MIALCEKMSNKPQYLVNIIKKILTMVIMKNNKDIEVKKIIAKFDFWVNYSFKHECKQNMAWHSHQIL